MKKIILLLASFAISCSTSNEFQQPILETIQNPPSNNQGSIQNPPPPTTSIWTQIPDSNFEKGIIELGIDDIEDGRVLTTSAESVTTLKLEHKRIQNISGIEAFKNVTFLSLWDNDFTDINLKTLTKLSILCLSECPLNTVDLSQNTELTQIAFQNASNRSTDPTYEYGKTKGFVALDLRYNTKLQRIYLWTNRIKTLDVSMCPNLTDLWLGGSESGPNSGNPIEYLDLSNNPKLNVIVVDNCALRYLNIKNTANAGVPRICATTSNPNLTEIKVSNVEKIITYRNKINSAGYLNSETTYKKDPQTNYVE